MVAPTGPGDTRQAAGQAVAYVQCHSEAAEHKTNSAPAKDGTRPD